MSADFSIRPVATPAPAQFVPAAREAVKTELPAQQTVTPSVVIQQARNDVAALAAIPDQISRQITFDRDAATVVYQSVDERTSEVVRQYPDDAILRRRAYFRTLDMMSAEKTPAPEPIEKRA
jgi:uncharacterized FlaG/YvyC family protein